MARIPQYGMDRVEESPLPGIRSSVRAPIEAFGGGENAIGDAAALAGTVGKMEQERLEGALKTAADEASTQLISEGSRLKLQVEQAKGKDALEASSKAVQDFEKYHGELEKNIGNPTVKQMVRAQYGHAKMNLGSFASRHAAQEMEVYDSQTHQAKIKSLQDSASQDWSPGNTATSVFSQKMEIEDFGKLRGMPPEVIQLNQMQAASDTHSLVINGMLSAGQDASAKEYFETNKNEMIGQQRAQAQAHVERESTLGQAQRMTDLMFRTKYEFMKDGHKVMEIPAPENMDQVRVETEKIENPTLRAEVERQAKTRIAENKYEAAQVYQSKLEQATDLVEKSASTRGLPEGLRTTHLRELERRAYELRSGEKKVMNDEAWKYFNYMKDLAANPDTRDQFLAVPPIEYRNRLPDAQFMDLRGDRTGLLKGDKKTLEKLESHRTDTELINVALDKLGLMSAHSDKNEKETFERVAREALTQETIVNDGKSLDNAAREKLMDGLIQDVVISKGTFWDTKEKGYRIADKNYNARLAEMGAAKQAEIEAALRRAGEPVTRARVIEYYLRGQERRK